MALPLPGPGLVPRVRSGSRYGRVTAVGHVDLAGPGGGGSVASHNKWLAQFRLERAPGSPIVRLLARLSRPPALIQLSCADTAADLQAQTLFERVVFQNGLGNCRFQGSALFLQAANLLRGVIPQGVTS